jgi:hypothetical protein
MYGETMRMVGGWGKGGWGYGGTDGISTSIFSFTLSTVSDASAETVEVDPSKL